jgi:hypothetical protein
MAGAEEKAGVAAVAVGGEAPRVDDGEPDNDDVVIGQPQVC